MSACCTCGGFTVPRKEKNAGATLAYQECGACGCCGRFDLRIAGVLVAKEQTARRMFQDAGAIAITHNRLTLN